MAQNRIETPWTLAWRRFRRHRMAIFSLGIIVLLVALALSAPLLVRLGWIPDPNLQPEGPNLAASYFLPPGTPGHPLGTDELGRDVLSRLIYGGRISLLVGFTVALSSVLIGTLVGAIAGYFAGRAFLFFAGPASPTYRELLGRGGLAVGLLSLVGFGTALYLFYRTGPGTALLGFAGALFAAHLLNRLPGLGEALARALWYGFSWALLLGFAGLIVDVARTLAEPGMARGDLSPIELAGYYLAHLGALALLAFGVVGRIALDVDVVISRIIDFMLSLPGLPILLVLSAFMRNPESALGKLTASLFGEAASVAIIILILVVFGWITTARIVRGLILSLREQEFTLAAQALGVSETRIVFRHLVPNAIAPIIVDATLQVGLAILVEAGLSFLGFGIQPPVATWGNMLTGAQDYIFYAPHLAIFPGLAILLTVLAFNYVGDGLRDALDPRSRV